MDIVRRILILVTIETWRVKSGDFNIYSGYYTGAWRYTVQNSSLSVEE